jgi:hypothetical protein
MDELTTGVEMASVMRSYVSSMVVEKWMVESNFLLDRRRIPKEWPSEETNSTEKEDS